MIYRIASRFFYVIGIACMFIPMLTHRPDTMYVLIPGGILLATIGILLMGPKEKKKRKQNNDIIDDG
jgi:hypothetical protein